MARKHAEEVLEQAKHDLDCGNDERRLVAQDLEGQKRLFDSLLENSAVAIFIVDEVGHIIRHNRVATSLFGADRLAGALSLTDLLAEDSRKTVRHFLAPDHDGEETGELLALTAEGDSFPLQATVGLVHLDTGVHTIWICHDLRVRKKFERELHQAQKMEGLGSIASGVAHEINTPIQFVGDNLRFLKDSFEDLLALVAVYRKNFESLKACVPAEAAEAVADAEEQADLDFLSEDVPESIEQSIEGMQRIGKIVAAIKEFSHPGVKDNAPIDVNKAIDTTIIVTKNQWKYVATLKTDLADDLAPVRGNPGDFLQVLLNLIVNAAHAISDVKRDTLGTIRISTRNEPSAVALRIEDNGCGMSDAVKTKMFDPFFTTKGVGKGTGQGLAITYNIIVNKMGGRIDVDSEPGRGTIFTITIPQQAEEVS